ncbi:bacteriocin immunity protein [Photobacterium piscicola]|uniref:bacteriocin immunity protein n=1 Tax=Photobacterium piscicola TaxID=1378299 RepID=UPI003735794D
MKSSLQDYSELEFLDLLSRSEEYDFDDKELDKLIYFFNKKIKHPKGSALITHPTICGIEDSPQAVVSELKRWYQEQGLPLFKD